MRAIVFNTLSERVSRKLRFDFYSSVIRQDLAFYDVRQTGKISKFKSTLNSLQIVSNMNSDIQVIQDALGSNFSMQFRAGITVIVVVVIMLFISPALTGVTFAGVLVVLLVTKFFMGQMVKAQKKIQTAKETMTQTSLESFQNIRTVKAFAAEDTEISSYNSANKTVFYRGLQKQLLGGVFQAAVQLLMYGGMALVILTAVWLL